MVGELDIGGTEWFQNNHTWVFYLNHKTIQHGLHMIMKT